MTLLHNKLSESVPLYRKWHQHAYASVVHFFILAIVSTIVANSMIAIISLPDESLTANTIDAGVVLTPRASGVGSDRVLVKFKKLTGQAKRDAMLAKNKLKEKSKISGIDVDVLTVDPAFTPEEVVQNILRDNAGDVEFAEVDQLLQPLAIPNDPNFSSQWNKAIVNAPTAWDTVTNSSNIIIGIADSGVDCTHEDLAASCVPGWNFVYNNSDTADIHGHGTSVAGAAAAIGNNGVGGSGTTWNAKIMPLQIYDPTVLGAYASVVAQSVVYAADRGAKVVNNSYGPFTTGGNSTINTAGKYLWDRGGILVRSEGNSGNDSAAAGVVISNDPYVLMVSGSDPSNNLYSWSTYGIDVDVAAPGCTPYVTARGGGYRSFCGTSNAAPEVAGLLALMWSANPSASPQTVRDALFSSATDFGTPGWDTRFGWGRIDAGRAIQTITGGTPPPPPSAPDLTANAITPSVATSGSPVTFSGTIVNNGNASTVNSFSNLFQVASASNGGGTISTISANTRAALSAGTSGSVSATPYTFSSAGTYSVRLCADSNTSLSGTIAESNENNNCSGWSNVSVADVPLPPPPVDVTAPSVPQNVTGNSAVSSHTNVSWSASTDNVAVTGYNLYRNGVKIWSGTNLAYTDTAVQPQTTYSYTVSAYDAVPNTSSQSTAVNITTPADVTADTTAPSTPQNLTASTYSSTQINLSWSASTDNVGVAGYNVFRNGAKVATTTSTGYNNTGLSANTTYTYTVSAYDAAGNTSPQSGTVSATTQATPLTINSFSVSVKSATSATVTWTTNQASTGSVSFGTVSTNLSKIVADANPSTSHTVTLTGLSKNTKYFYQVSATGTSGSAKSAISSFKTSPH